MASILVEKRLKSIGMNIFVSYYLDFKNSKQDRGKLASKLLKDNPKASSLDAQKTRISNARKIFEENLQIDALEIITNSERVGESVINRAKEILNSERKSSQF